VEGSCEHGNEPSGSIKCWEVLEWLHNWQLLKKGSLSKANKQSRTCNVYSLRAGLMNHQVPLSIYMCTNFTEIRKLLALPSLAFPI
jgi:hypothetical protein